jgi:signal transduction histidine kinase
MKRRTLRRRLNTVLLQWFLLLVVASGVVLVISFATVRQNVVDDRLLLARTIAHYLDATLSTALQDLGRLSGDLPALDAKAAARLRVFRFQSPFREATYVVDEHGRLIVGDPPDARPLGAEHLGMHEALTSLVRKAGSEQRPVLAMIQPFRQQHGGFYLVAEMQPLGSIVSTFLQDLATDPDLHVAVIDDNGVIVASSDQRELFRTMPGADAYRQRIRAHRPLVSENLPCEPREECAEAMLTVMAPLRMAPWGVVIMQDKARALSSMYTARRGLLAAGLMLAAVGLLLSRGLSRSVVAPIRQLSRQAERIRAGDLTSAITVTGDYEVEVLAETLDEARQRLASTLQELRTLNEDLEKQVVQRTQVIEGQYQQRQVLVRRLLSATEEERRRLARELHDEISQLLTVIQMSLDRVEAVTPEMEKIRGLLAQTQTEIHRIIHDLRPSLLDDLGLAAAMKSYAEDHLVAGGLSVSLEIDETLPPRPELEIATFRIYQEILTNIVRHARAETVSIELYEQEGRLVLAVEDDGVGFDPSAKSDGAGLVGMRERAALVNGTIRFDSEPGNGTHVVLEIPVQ